MIVHQTGVRQQATVRWKAFNRFAQFKPFKPFSEAPDVSEELPRFGNSRNVEMTISSRGEGEIISSPGGVMS